MIIQKEEGEKIIIKIRVIENDCKKGGNKTKIAITKEEIEEITNKGVDRETAIGNFKKEETQEGMKENRKSPDEDRRQGEKKYNKKQEIEETLMKQRREGNSKIKNINKQNR